jgi:hypothetical protein
MKTFGVVLAVILAGSARGQSKSFDKPCSDIWSASIREMIDRKFQPILMDKDTGVATFSYVGPAITARGLTDKDQAFLDEYVRHDNFQFVHFKVKPKEAEVARAVLQLRMDSVSLTVSPVKEGGCSAKMTIGYAVLSAVTKGWFVAESNFNQENAIFAKVADALK